MIKDRAFNALNLNQYSNPNKCDLVSKLKLEQPLEDFYILRILIKKMFDSYKIPENLMWCKPLIDKAEEYQNKIGISHPFVYLTIRKGLVKSTTDDEWHVDGFSQTITHLPEQNYIWTDIQPTEYIEKGFVFPKDFHPLKHNIHNFFQNRILEDDKILTMKEETLYCLDPYIIHRRPNIRKDIKRCFIRLSFTPIEINDVNNTYNPLLKTNYTRDGVKVMRNKLISYDNM